ncbi:MAG: DciA family protein, partial [Xanthobacteraceae bacterium]
AAHSEPMRIQWTRPADGDEREPGTLVLRVEGPAAIEIQHLGDVICERVNRFLGWRAVARLALRQAPLHHGERKAARVLDTAAATRIAETLTDIRDDDLKGALARLGAAIKRP